MIPTKTQDRVVDWNSSWPLRHSCEQLAGQRLVLFSYGSGLASTMLSVRVSSDAGPNSPLARLTDSLADLKQRLDARSKISPQEFSETMKLREETHHKGMLNFNRFSGVLGTGQIYNPYKLHIAPRSLILPYLPPLPLPSAPYSPVGSLSTLSAGTWYVTGVDAQHRRTYSVANSSLNARKVSGLQLSSRGFIRYDQKTSVICIFFSFIVR